MRNGARTAPDPTKQRGATLYLDNCSGCHQASGRGIPGVFPPLAGNGVVVAADPNNIIKVVDRGIAARAGFVAMPSFATQLTDQQVADIANYVRTSWGNKAPAERDSRRWSRKCGRRRSRRSGGARDAEPGNAVGNRDGWRARQESNL